VALPYTITGARDAKWLPAATPLYFTPEQPYSVLVWVDERGIARAKDSASGKIIAESADHASVIQAAIDSLPPFPAGEVLLKRGMYDIKRTIKILRSGFTLRGEGRGTLLVLADGASCDMIQVGDGTNYYREVTVADLELTGNKANNAAGSGIVVNGVGRTVIERCYVNNFKQHGILLTGTPARHTKFSVIRDNRIYSNDGHGVYALKYSYNDHIVNNDIAWNASGVRLEGGGETLVLGNSIWGNSVFGIEVYACYGLRIAANMVLDSGNDNIRIGASNRILVIGNWTSYGSRSSTGIFDEIRLVAGSTATTSDVLVLGNYCDPGSYAAFAIREDGAGAFQNNLIAFNRVKPGTAGTIYAKAAMVVGNEGHRWVGQTVSVGADASLAIPAGLWYASLAPNTLAEVYNPQTAAWETAIAAGGKGFIASDGSNARLRNTGTATENSYLIRAL